MIAPPLSATEHPPGAAGGRDPAPGDLLARWDVVRAPLHVARRPDGYKEWQHFVVHRPGLRLVVNFSVMAGPADRRGAPLVPRVVVIARHDRWTGVVERFTQAELDVSADLRTLRIGANVLALAADGYRVRVELPAHEIAGELVVRARSRPFVVNNQPLGAGRLSWLFVPRLEVDGWFHIAGTTHHFASDAAYHDHNWGRFRWGDDFGWSWGSVLAEGDDQPWSLVFMRMTDGLGQRALSQALYLWRRDEPVAMFRDGALRIESSGSLARPPDRTLPAPMRLVLGGRACAVPEQIELEARRGAHEVRAVFRPEAYLRLAQPSEVDLRGCTVLEETSGQALVQGSVAGRAFQAHGPGVVELLHA